MYELIVSLVLFLHNISHSIVLLFQLQPVGQQLIGQLFTFIQKRQASINIQQQHQPQQYSAIQDFDLHDSPVSKKRNKPRKT